MRVWCRLFLTVLASGVLVAARPPVETAAQAPKPKPVAGNHVVIISLDGFGTWALDDPYTPLPALRRLAAEGATAKTMRPVNPTVTWPNHTSMVTGVTPAKHGVLFNGLLVRDAGVPPRVEPWRDKSEMVRGDTLYDIAHRRGLTTAEVDWVAIQNPKTITWAFSERPDPAAQIPREMVAAGAISQADLDTFSSKNIVFRDQIWTAAAAHIIGRHKPNLALVHLLNLDSTQHRYGPRTHAAMTTMAHLDTQVGAIVEAVRQAGLAERTTLFVVSDHGFKTVKRQIRPNAALQKAGLLEVVNGKIVKSQVYTVPEGGTAIVYVTAADADGQLLARARAALAGVEGIDLTVDPQDYAAYGLPTPEHNAQMGALFLTAKEGYSFGAAAGDAVAVDTAEGGFGSHGYVASDPDLGALFIASGRGIRKGARLDAVQTIDLAPTAARLLEVDLKDVDGRVLEEILVAPPPSRR